MWQQTAARNAVRGGRLGNRGFCALGCWLAALCKPAGVVGREIGDLNSPSGHKISKRTCQSCAITHIDYQRRMCDDLTFRSGRFGLWALRFRLRRPAILIPVVNQEEIALTSQQLRFADQIQISRFVWVKSGDLEAVSFITVSIFACRASTSNFLFFSAAFTIFRLTCFHFQCFEINPLPH